MPHRPVSTPDALERWKRAKALETRLVVDWAANLTQRISRAMLVQTSADLADCLIFGSGDLSSELVRASLEYANNLRFACVTVVRKFLCSLM